MRDAYFTSDHHFGHKAVIKYGGRPFASVQDMDESLIKAWNQVVKHGDTVYHLGDFSFHRPDARISILSRLNGAKHLIQGNHDHLKAWEREHWQSVQHYLELRIDGRKLVLCHYPFVTWNQSHRGSWQLHGHSHGNLTAPASTRLDVGVDARESWAPWSYDEVCEVMQGRSYLPVDHHTERR